MEDKYKKAIELLKTSHSCPSNIAQEYNIDENVLHNITDGCHYDEWMGNCKFCRENALEFMLKNIS